MGGRDHTTHHLSYLGLSDGQVALTYIGLSLLNLFLVFVVFRFIAHWSNLHTIVFVSYALLVFIALFIITRRSKPPLTDNA